MAVRSVNLNDTRQLLIVEQRPDGEAWFRFQARLWLLGFRPVRSA